MKITWSELEVPGLLISDAQFLEDERGTFGKVMSGSPDKLPEFVGRELFWTKSRMGVLRGLHFQVPPAATSKLVFVVAGAIRDFVVDLRVGSPMERRLFEIELRPNTGSLVVPGGCAHAYESLEDGTIVCYAQDVPFADVGTYAGIRADSAGIVPRCPTPIVSERDLGLPKLADFASPFTFAE